MIRLRQRYPGVSRPFRVPFYPWVPLLFIATSAYVFCSSLAYVRVGAVLSVVVLGIGAVLMLFLERRSAITSAR